MRYDPDSHTLTLEPTTCRACRYYSVPGTEPTKDNCPKCGGTGRGPRGGKYGCRECNGYGSRWNHEVTQPCSKCGGDYEGKDFESICDSAPKEAVDALPITVIRQEREASFSESYLGFGCLYSVTDYGRAWNADSSAALAVEVADDLHRGWTQAIKIVHDHKGDSNTYDMATGLVVIVTRGGYSVRAYFEGRLDALLTATEQQMPAEAAMRIGTMYAAMGGNGTMLAATL